MGLQIKATKVYKNLPCGHAQHFDTNDDGTPGHCAQVHGYDRSVEFTFAGDVDEHGWITWHQHGYKAIEVNLRT